MTGGQAGESTAEKKRGVGDRECATKLQFSGNILIPNVSFNLAADSDVNLPTFFPRETRRPCYYIFGDKSVGCGNGCEPRCPCMVVGRGFCQFLVLTYHTLC